jgi:uncharacterized repeat protein (TIGR03803 family)
MGRLDAEPPNGLERETFLPSRGVLAEIPESVDCQEVQLYVGIMSSYTQKLAPWLWRQRKHGVVGQAPLRLLFVLPGAFLAIVVPVPSVLAQHFRTLYSFTAASSDPHSLYATNREGAYPQDALTLSGNTLYGTANGGGTSGGGTVFGINTDGTGFTNLHSFTVFKANNNGLNTNSDGFSPQGDLVLAGNALYGVANDGGSSGHGTVFAVNTDGTGFTNLHTFTATSSAGFNSDGADPKAQLALSGATLYGMTYEGGSAGAGTVFAISVDGAGFTNLHNNTGGTFGWGGGLVSSGSTLYGTTWYGGSSGNGTLFAISTDGTGFTNLHVFSVSRANSSGLETNNDGISPEGLLVLSSNTLYGTTASGGNWGNGTVFAANTDGTGFTNLHSFTATSGTHSTNIDGANPFAGLALRGHTLYGTTQNGGESQDGTVFSINTDGTGFATLYNFSFMQYSGSHYTNEDGAIPQGAVTVSGNTLYGTTASGGSAGSGTVFSLTFSPQLQVVPLGTEVILRWPTNYAGFDYSGFALQSSMNLGPSPIWATNSLRPVVVNGQYAVTNPITGTQQFYRLSQ